MARSTALVVFLLPAIISIFFGTMVLGEVLKQPDRELHLAPGKISGTLGVPSGTISIVGIEEIYPVGDSVEISVSVSDEFFDCGDLYITVYDVLVSPKEVITQSGYFEQCYANNNLVMPIGDEFSEPISTPGSYEIVAEINDKGYQKTLTATKKFIVQ